jgi:hypothetical protein
MQEILQTPAAKRTSLRLFCNTPQKCPSTSGTIGNKCLFNQGTGIPSQRGACQEVPCDHGVQRFCLAQVPLDEMQQQNPHMRVLGSANEVFLQGRVEQVLLGFQTLRDMTVFMGLQIYMFGQVLWFQLQSCTSRAGCRSPASWPFERNVCRGRCAQWQ